MIDRAFLQAMKTQVGCGPFDGGCLIVAQAIQAVAGGEIVPLVDEQDEALHAVVLKNGVLWDYDGPLETNLFLDRYNSFVDDAKFKCVRHREFRAYDLTEAMENDGLAATLASMLQRVLPQNSKAGTGLVLSAVRPIFDEIEIDDPAMFASPFRIP
jgi:hypothetical protein